MPKNNQLNIFQHNNRHIIGPIQRKMHKALKKLLSSDDGRPDRRFEYRKKRYEIIDVLLINKKTTKLYT